MTTLTDKNVSSAPQMNKLASHSWLNITLVILMTITILTFHPGGHAMHVISGILMLIGCSIHLVLHRRWIKAVILDTPPNLTPALRLRRRLFWGMAISGFLCGFSGLGGLLLIHNPHIFLPAFCCGAPIHILSGFTFLGLNIYHVTLHRSWFTKILGKKP